MVIKFTKKIGSALTAAQAVTDELSPSELAGLQYLGLYIVGSAGIASGAVQPETAHAAAYAGTWAAIGSPITATASAVKYLAIAQAMVAFRARISTEIGSGTVDVWAIGFM